MANSIFGEIETMIFSQDDLEKLQMEYLAVDGKCQKLLLSYVARNFNNARAQEYARQGFSRRLKTLVRCIHKTFEVLPLDRIEIPTKEELSDAAINIQAFIINVFGCTDNLAWVWLWEKNLTQNDGSPIPNGWVGLREKNELVRGSFSPGFQAYLEGLNGWFENLENFRHALAHRIPLYIPPYVVPEDKLPAYQELGERMTEALNRQDIAEHERLSTEQEALAAFKPFMTHSFEEEAKYVVFHAQLLADFNTIDELGKKLLEELDR
jgi:hypothetical protein